MLVVNENNRCVNEPEKPFKPVTIVLETEREYHDMSAALWCVNYLKVQQVLKANEKKIREYHDMSAALWCVNYLEVRQVLKANEKDKRATRQLRGAIVSDVIGILQEDLFDMMAPFREQLKQDGLPKKESV